MRPYRPLVLAAAVAALAPGAGPAGAEPHWETCTTSWRTTTSVQICLDVEGTMRAAYVEGWGVLQPVDVEILDLSLLECDDTGISSDPCRSTVVRDAGRVQGLGWVTFRGRQAQAFIFGATYRACATLSVNGERYDRICSAMR